MCNYLLRSFWFQLNHRFHAFLRKEIIVAEKLAKRCHFHSSAVTSHDIHDGKSRSTFFHLSLCHACALTFEMQIKIVYFAPIRAQICHHHRTGGSMMLSQIFQIAGRKECYTNAMNIQNVSIICIHFQIKKIISHTSVWVNWHQWLKKIIEKNVCQMQYCRTKKRIRLNVDKLVYQSLPAIAYYFLIIISFF